MSGPDNSPPKEPVMVPVSTVLSMFRAHLDKNDKEFEVQALVLAQYLYRIAKNEELAMYILAQYGLTPTWTTQ